MPTPYPFARTLLLSAATALFLTSPAAASQAVGGDFRTYHQIPGIGAGDRMGQSSAVLDDVDGDGLPDFAVGALFANPNGLVEAGSVFVYSGANGSLIYRRDGETAGERFGYAVANAGDVDGDGRGDLLVGAPYRSPVSKRNAGAVYVISGATGTRLDLIVGAREDTYLGSALAGGYDLDGDLLPDFVWSALHGRDPTTTWVPGPGYVQAVSSATGQELWIEYGPELHAHLGHALSFFDDIDGDQVQDLIITVVLKTVNGVVHVGSVRTYSGATGTQIWEMDGNINPHSHFGITVAAPGDVNADGTIDVLVGAPRSDLHGGLNKAGYARAYSGSDGTPLYEWIGSQDFQNFGLALAGAGDVDSDGHDDMVVCAMTTDVGSLNDAGTVWVYSGATGLELYKLEGTGTGDSLGSTAAGPADWNGDGVEEFLMASAGYEQGGGPTDAGLVIIQGYHPILLADSNTISASAGANLEFTIDFPPSEAGFPYAALLSATGTGPTNYKGVDVPLSRDNLFARTVSGLYPPGTSNMAGTLDASGDALATATILPGQVSSYLGNTFWMAVVSIGTTGNARGSSAVVALEVVP